MQVGQRSRDCYFLGSPAGAGAAGAGVVAGTEGGGAVSNNSSAFCGKPVNVYSAIWKARFAMWLFTGAEASE